MRILIADDDPVCRLLLRTVLAELGYDVVDCEDGLGAWTRLQQPDAPRVVILDWMMPGMNGLQVCRAIRERSDREYTYVILLTAKTQKKDLVSAFQAGADDFLTKPVDEDQLLARLNAAQRILGDGLKRAAATAPAAAGPAPAGGPAAGAAPPAGGVSAAEFLRYLAENDLPDCAEAAGGLGAAADGAALARELVAAGKLTTFQADALLGRRFGDLRIGNYQILDRLGAGGMGTVFKARHRRMKRVVALKVIAREVAGDEVFAQRFQREVETIARLNHPNIVMAFDADESAVGSFLVMEFVDGRNLAAVVARGGPLTVREAVGDVLQAARGLAYAHACGIVHRDIKPENILRDAAGVIKVADLGLARLNAPSGHNAAPSPTTSLTQAGTVVGTAQYMAPEQAVESAVDHRADVYALGCTLYFLLVGRPPYRGDSLMGVLLNHRDAPIPSLRDPRPDVPPDLEAVYRRMVAKRPDDRSQTMAEVVTALEQVQAVLARRPAPPGAEPAPPVPAGDPGPPVRTAVGDSLLVGENWEISGPDLFSELVAPPAGWFAGVVAVVVETSAARAEAVANGIQALGVRAVHIAGSGRQAIDTAKRVGARVVIGSLHPPDMTGAQLAAALRAAPECPDVGVVLTTDGSDPGATAGWSDAPRTALLPEPFDLIRLSDALTRVLR